MSSRSLAKGIVEKPRSVADGRSMRANDAVDRVPRLIIKRLAANWEGGGADGSRCGAGEARRPVEYVNLRTLAIHYDQAANLNNK